MRTQSLRLTLQVIETRQKWWFLATHANECARVSIQFAISCQQNVRTCTWFF